MLEQKFIEILRDKNIPEKLINDVIDSGYILRNFHDPFSGFQLWRVSDKMYGNKQHSSLFNIDDFVKYIQGDNVFEKLPSFTEITVKNYKDIESFYLSQGGGAILMKVDFHSVVKYLNILIREKSEPSKSG
ncbi:hypothetical protein N1Z48_00011410 [Klebsiella pneumoniae]